MRDSRGKGRCGGGEAKRGKKKKGGIDGSILKEKDGNNYENSDSMDDHDFVMGGKGGGRVGEQ